MSGVERRTAGAIAMLVMVVAGTIIVLRLIAGPAQEVAPAVQRPILVPDYAIWVKSLSERHAKGVFVAIRPTSRSTPLDFDVSIYDANSGSIVLDKVLRGCTVDELPKNLEDWPELEIWDGWGVRFKRRRGMLVEAGTAIRYFRGGFPQGWIGCSKEDCLSVRRRPGPRAQNPTPAM